MKYDNRCQSTLGSGLLDGGLTLMRAGGQMPGRARGWRLEFAGAGRVRLVGRRGLVAFAGACRAPGDWREVAAEIGGCVVLIGSVGLYAVADET